MDGKAIVVHAGSGDNMTDPSGDFGDRIACEVILLSLIHGVINGL
jgi:Cu/Zn superoxide dismutase